MLVTQEGHSRGHGRLSSSKRLLSGSTNLAALGALLRLRLPPFWPFWTAMTKNLVALVALLRLRIPLFWPFWTAMWPLQARLSRHVSWQKFPCQAGFLVSCQQQLCGNGTIVTGDVTDEFEFLADLAVVTTFTTLSLSVPPIYSVALTTNTGEYQVTRFLKTAAGATVVCVGLIGWTP